MQTAKLFTNGSRQAVSLPDEFRFSGTEVCVQKTGSAVMLVPMEKAWTTFLEGINDFTDDYFDAVISRNDDEHEELTHNTLEL